MGQFKHLLKLSNRGVIIIGLQLMATFPNMDLCTNGNYRQIFVDMLCCGYLWIFMHVICIVNLRPQPKQSEKVNVTPRTLGKIEILIVVFLIHLFKNDTYK